MARSASVPVIGWAIALALVITESATSPERTDRSPTLLTEVLLRTGYNPGALSSACSSISFSALLMLRPGVHAVPACEVEAIEKHEPTLEERLERLVDRLRGFRQKPLEELDEIIDDLNTVLNIVEKIISALENIGGAERAEKLVTLE
jgi:hypothetical protein